MLFLPSCHEWKDKRSLALCRPRQLDSFVFRSLLTVKYSPTGGLYHSDGKREGPEKPRRHASTAQATVNHWTPKHTDCGLRCIPFTKRTRVQCLLCFNYLEFFLLSWHQSSASRPICSPHVCNTCSRRRQFSTRCASIKGGQTFYIPLPACIPPWFTVLHGLPK
jgi:hypothetical protein